MSAERPDPGGIVRRGDAVGFRGHVEGMTCFVERHGETGMAPPNCERAAVMEVYGLAMCGPHGEEAATMALEEIYHDLENELMRPMNGAVRPLSPHMEAALSRGFGVLAGNHRGSPGADDALLAAFPLDRSRVCGETLSYAENGSRSDGHEAPFDAYMGARLLLHRLMRLAFEEEADWLVETLERERESVAAQAAYALALDPDGPPA